VDTARGKTIVMPPGPVSCIGGTKYPHCIVLYCKRNAWKRDLEKEMETGHQKICISISGCVCPTPSRYSTGCVFRNGSTSNWHLWHVEYCTVWRQYRPSLVSCCSIHRLEFIACLPPVFIVSLHFSTTAEDISLSAIIPRHRHFTSLHYATVDFVMAVCHFSHVKNTD